MTKLVALALLLTASVAHADPTERSHVSATVGLATPVGEAGIEGAFVLRRHLEIAAGVGASGLVSYGSDNESHMQLAVMPRVRFPMRHAVFTLGAGLSGGRYTVSAGDYTGLPFAARTSALWVNGEAGLDVFLGKLVVGGYLGYGKVAAHGEIIDSYGQPQMELPDDELPYFGVRVGYAF